MAKAPQAIQPELDNIPGAGSADPAAEQAETLLPGQMPQGAEGNQQDETNNADAASGADPAHLDPPIDPGEPSLLECAVLMDCIYGKHDEIIELPAEQAHAAEDAGFVDTHPNAVAAIRAGV